MINVLFQQQQKVIAIKIEGKHLTFATLQGFQTPQYTTIDGLKLDIGGILQEFPDLQDKEPKEIKKIAIERFKKKLTKFQSEMSIKDYLVEDLKKYGFKFKGYQKKGHRYIKA